MRKTSRLKILWISSALNPFPFELHGIASDLVIESTHSIHDQLLCYDLCMICVQDLNDVCDYEALFHSLPAKGRYLLVNVNDEQALLSASCSLTHVDYLCDDYAQKKFNLKIKSLIELGAQRDHEQDLLNLAKYDVVTGLANRHMFFDFYASAKPRAKRTEKSIALLLIEIENHHVLHSTLGHDVVDDMLIEFASRLKEVIRESDLASRMGTDKFGVLAPDLSQPTDASRIAQKIIDAVSDAFMVEGEHVYLRVNVGIALYPFDECMDCDIERASEMALMQAKQSGSKQICYYEPHMQAFASERLKIEKGLKVALLNQEFSLVYQPKVGAMSGEIEGVEALIRWESTEWGLMSPDSFISVAEDTGLIEEIGEWVLYEGLKDARAWLDIGLFENKIISINVSAFQLSNEKFVLILQNALKTYQFPAHQLELELTESCLMHDQDFGIKQLRHIRDLGVRIAIDDFGTGYSSLNYLRHLPIHTLKIDKSFVREIGNKEGGEEIVKVIISLCRIYHLQTIAEGVETDEELMFLRALLCDTIQGYYFSKPVKPKEMVNMLSQEPFLLTPKTNHSPSTKNNHKQGKL